MSRSSLCPSQASVAEWTLSQGTLCPDLVAPAGNETVLGLPNLCPDLQMEELPVLNADLEPVLGLRLQGANLELFEWSGGRSLASCLLHPGGAKLLAVDGSLRAWLSREEGGEYALRGCAKYRLVGQRLASLVAMAETMAAVTECQRGYVWLKAGPGVDAGLMLLAMLAVDRLSSE